MSANLPPSFEPLASQADTPEATLWQEFKAGDEASFALIYQKFFSCLFSYGIKLGAEPEVVKDCIQDLFIYLWHHRGSVANTDSIQYYLWAALKRRILRAIASPASAVHSLTPSFVLPATEGNIEDQLITEEITQQHKRRLLSVMQSLTKRQQEAVHLKFFQSLKNEEIAERMSIHVEAVYNLISKSLTTLRKGMAKSTVVGLLLDYLLRS